MGQPIENAATDAARKKAEELRDQVLAEEKNGKTEALERLPENTQNNTTGVVGNPPLSPLQHLVLAQQQFISDQTAFIHDPKNLPHMFDSQLEYLVGLQRYLSVAKLPVILSLQERYIAELHEIVGQVSPE